MNRRLRKNQQQAALVAGSFAALLILGGCKASDLTDSVGHYQGILTQKTGAQTVQTMVSGDIASPGFLHLDMKVATIEPAPRHWEYLVAANPRGQVMLTEAVSRVTTTLKAGADQCYINADAPAASDASTRVCYGSNQITIDLPTPDGSQLDFLMTRTDPANMPVMEPPADFKLSDLQKRALTRSFSSQLEFESVINARLTALNAHLSLLPSFSLSDVLGLTTAITAWQQLVQFVGNVTPFLIPSNWFKARTADFQNDAEHYGYLLMEADAGNIAAGLSYAVVRDQMSLATIQKERGLIAGVRQEVYDRERLGFLPEHYTDSIDAALVAADQTILGLQQTIDSEFTSLAMAVGFFNPQAVRSVTIDNDLSVQHPETFDLQQSEHLAEDRSAELKQLDFLIDAAANTARESYFDWLSPQGMAVGPALGTYIALARNQVAIARTKRQQMQAQIMDNVKTTITALNTSVAGYALAERGIAIQNALVDNYIDNIRMGIAVNPQDLLTAFGAQMQAQLNVINTEFQYLVSLDTMERTLYEGPYVNLGSLAPPAPIHQ